MQLDQISVRPIVEHEEEKHLELMASGHYLGAIRRIGESICYVAIYEGQWIALISFSAAVLQCEARDRWIGWHYRHQTGRLKLLANNSRFLLLRPGQVKNLGSRLLSLCLKRLSNDWTEKYGHPVLLVETLVDPERYHDKDRSTIRTGHGPENMTRLRRFATGLLKSKSVKNRSKKTRMLNRNTRACLIT